MLKETNLLLTIKERARQCLWTISILSIHQIPRTFYGERFDGSEGQIRKLRLDNWGKDLEVRELVQKETAEAKKPKRNKQEPTSSLCHSI